MGQPGAERAFDDRIADGLAADVAGPEHDLVEKIRYYLAHEEERSAIAHAGQERTLKDHTYLQRMKELEQIIEAYS